MTKFIISTVGIYIAVFCLITTVVAAETNDSTTVRLAQYTLAQHKAIPDTTQCVQSANLGVKTVFNTIISPQQEADCPAGYVAYGFITKTYVLDGTGQYNWQYQCCKLKVSYS